MSYYQRHQPHMVEQAVRTLSESIQDNSAFLSAVDTKISILDMNANAGLADGTDFVRLNTVNADAEIHFQFERNGETKKVSFNDLMDKFDEYDQKIAELEERLATADFYSDRVA